MMNMRFHSNTAPAEALMQKLRQVDFALYDTILYLDAYPNCRKALAHYHTLLEMHKNLKTEYEKEYGPITAFGNESKSSYDWTSTPWPWETT
jgi:spore coat protein JB